LCLLVVGAWEAIDRRRLAELGLEGEEMKPEAPKNESEFVAQLIREHPIANRP